MNEPVAMKRMKRRIKSCPNPLFESWLKEWRDEAKRNGSEMHYCFSRALKSLQKYPFKLETGKECFILENFGTKLCMMIDKKLSQLHRSGEDISVTNKATSDLGEKMKEKSHDSYNVSSSFKTSTNSFDDGLSNINHALGNDLVQKRKNCMDSPIRTLKQIRDNSYSVQSKQNKRNKGGTYLPGYRSGGYAIILTLHNKSEAMTKAELEVEAQNLCNVPFKKTANSHYSAWSAMSTLVKKGLVDKNGRPVRFSLTAEGVSVALKLKSAEDEHNGNTLSASDEISLNNISSEQYPNFNLSVTINSSVKEQSQLSTSKDQKKEKSVENNLNKELPRLRNERITAEVIESMGEKSKSVDDMGKSEETFFLLPSQFDIILYVDNKEMENKKNVESDKIVRYLNRRNVKFEVKNLSVGDYLWVCRDRKTNGELVLPYIVERKRMDDLASSVKDGRFHEQKFRLKNCGVKNCIYLVEKYGNDSTRLGLPLPTIQQAISNTRVIDGFQVKITNNNDESLCYLSLLTEFLTITFKEKTLVSCKKSDLPDFILSDEILSLMTFPEFNKDSEKMRKFTVRNMLVKHLLQLNGVSVERARAIVQLFPTPKSLIEALKSPGGDSIIANIKFGALDRSVGSNIAKSLQQLYTSPRLE